jgi:hypothetical protein
MKGQTAVEYLMTYGWAILIILIVAGVLAYYGIFAPSGFLGQSVRGFTTIVVLQPWGLSIGGALQANLENRVGSPITLNHVYLIDSNGAVSDVANTTDFSTAQKQIVSVTLPAGAGTAIPATAKTGDVFTYTLVIEYLYGTSNYFNSTGTISGAFS